MNLQLKPYKKDFDFSYSYGVYPTIELLQQKPSKALKVILSAKGSRNRGVEQIIKICREKNIPTENGEGLINKLSSSHNNYAMGVFRKYSSPIEPHRNHLVLVGPRDSGNLGTIIRTALGFDLKDIAIIRPAIDIFDPKSVRASMGALFQINFSYFDSFSDYQSQFKQHLYPFMTNVSSSVENTRFSEPYSLVFGNESAGLDDSFLKVGEPVKINYSSSIDSLNLSVAVGIGLYKAFLSKSK